MRQIVFGGVSPRALGDLLKGYGLIAIIGQQCPEAQFWWDEGFHLVVEFPRPQDRLVEELLCDLPQWAEGVAAAFGRTVKKSCDNTLPCPDLAAHLAVEPRFKQKRNKKKCSYVMSEGSPSPLKSGLSHDTFDPAIAEIARSASMPRGDSERIAEPHPLFGSYGQDGTGRGNYFGKLAEAAGSAKNSNEDLGWSLFGLGTEPVKETVDKGFLFFPEPTTRYATGVSKWEQEKASVTAWCFLLAMRGALTLRGTLRRLRWRRDGYPAFPFVFEGAGIAEVHLPTWGKNHPRVLDELLRQIRHFHVPLGQGNFAATAGEFRAAVQRRGPAVGFDTFHRFNIEARRPRSGGERDRLPQAIPRGLTRVREFPDGVDLRGMIAPLGESGWIDQFVLPRRKDNEEARAFALERRNILDSAIHRAVDEPILDAYLGVLESVWELSRELLLQGKLRRSFEKHGRTPRPAPPLPATVWERSLAEGLRAGAEWRLARALGSIVGIQAGGQMMGPILQQLLPVRYRWDRATWTVAESATAAPVWSGRLPMRDFQALLWQRWRLSEGLPRLPFAGARKAPLDDVLSLLRGELDVALIHRLTPLFALLDWQATPSPGLSSTVRPRLPLSPAYAALRLWLDLGVSPPVASPPPRDGEVPRLLSLGGGPQVGIAVERALARLRYQGLPWHEQTPPTGKAVVKAKPRISAAEAQLMALAIMVPISRDDTLALSQRLHVAFIEKEISA
jgi:CRISPR-associated protein Csx17